MSSLFAALSIAGAEHFLPGAASAHLLMANCVAKTVYAATVRVSSACQTFHSLPAEDKGAKGPKVQHRRRGPHQQQPSVLC